MLWDVDVDGSDFLFSNKYTVKRGRIYASNYSKFGTIDCMQRN